MLVYNGIFKTVSGENVAYWLGFLAADGSVHKKKKQLMIGLARKDKKHLEKFLSFIGSNVEIKDRDMTCSTNGKSYPSSLIHITNKELIDDLSQYNIVANKSNQNIDFLQYIPEQYKIYFILGYFDGDGYFTFTSDSHAFGVCGCYNNTNAIANYLKQYFKLTTTAKCNQYKRSLITYAFTDSKIDDIKIFCEFYLNQIEVVDLLDRKVEKAKQLLDFIINKHKIDISIKAIKNVSICPICNTRFYALNHNTQKYCSQECAHIAQQRIERPNRDDLKGLIRTLSFLQIGKKFNVSDNTIRKWCKSLNLPYKVTEIKNVSDEEWILI